MKQTLKHIFEFKFAWLCLFFLAILAIFISHFPPFSTFHLSPLMVAVLFGCMVVNFSPKSSNTLKKTGILSIATKQILRFGIILFGFRISFDSISELGIYGILFVALVVFSTFALAIFIGKWLGLSKSLSALIGSGSAICGAAAVMASASTIKASEQDTASAICTVVLFGTIGMFVYPFIFKVGLLGFDADMMGRFTGASLHEVAHVIAAGANISESAKASAVIVKMLRVLTLVPFLIVLSIFFRSNKSGKMSVFPYFALYFFAAVCINSLFAVPEILLTAINHLATFLLCAAMCALGFGLNKNTFANMGFKPFLLAALLFAWLFVFCFSYIKFIF
ncbi:putative sulfate exporter family transporter [Campylobacter sp. RM9344]|uniref:Sulfate exporter family transporter n=1 Tax=Campylobacter californiensis TaxID=1032243 RepID=A0AAW3ZSD6_9BACT|nr:MULTISPECIES: putative sulfate exporter family transporter [unclassified Campylobacter]MBE2984442.1 putative sulfate exporter family transporter [Campylobacter sp. RM6883]MBE2985781.1 putative sulfate exporter family transporter [Campylobacter sp. RM12919]MBE2987896.1 putative sulfate exporter family transporter [Campylobacter sp. RM12920]MBE2995028.1 putative sulfate exporter family transporter [Campylobacter sp. RM6913]MBE3028881.1 putative sulfate exporter family transporter [Campylobact